MSLSALLGNYDRQTDRPTNRQRVGPGHIVSLSIIDDFHGLGLFEKELVGQVSWRGYSRRGRVEETLFILITFIYW